MTEKEECWSLGCYKRKLLITYLFLFYIWNTYHCTMSLRWQHKPISNILVSTTFCLLSTQFKGILKCFFQLFPIQDVKNHNYYTRLIFYYSSQTWTYYEDTSMNLLIKMNFNYRQKNIRWLWSSYSFSNF